MRYATSAAFRKALEQRLRTHAQGSNVSVMRLRKIVVFDRLMARLLIAAPDRWVLKSTLALDLRLASQFRTTRDMDLVRQDDEETANEDFIAAQELDLGDYFTFVIRRVHTADTAFAAASVRYHVTASLAGRRFEDIAVDVGFADAVVLPSEIVPGSSLLVFADIAPIEVPVLSLEQHVAEKLHAYTRTYSDHRTSSRVKDLIDLVVIQAMREFEAGRLRQAIESIFDGRATHPVPFEIPASPTDWTQPYRALALEAGLDPDLVVG